MRFEANLLTREVYRRLLRLMDRFSGVPFAQMRRVKQISMSHCGPAVLTSLFSFVGVSVSQTQITRSIRAQNKIKRFGLGIAEMARAAKIYNQEGGFIFWKKSKANIGDIEKIVNKYKFPVGVEWQGVFYEDEDEDNGHYSIATGINKKMGYLRIADPYYKFSGVDRRINLKLFKSRWWDTNMVGKKEIHDDRVMFVITPRGTLWPQKMGMRRV